MWKEVFISHHKCLKRYATNWNVADLGTDEVIDCFAIYLILPAALGLGFTQPLTKMSTTKSFSGGKLRPARKAKNLIAICEPTGCSILDNS
jgi:hypothetical protein